MERINDNILILAVRLYTDLPWWKKRGIFRWYRSNNWDVTGNWMDCVKVARKMYADAHFQLTGTDLSDSQ